LKGRVKKLLITLFEGGCCRKFSYPSKGMVKKPLLSLPLQGGGEEGEGLQRKNLIYPYKGGFNGL